MENNKKKIDIVDSKEELEKMDRKLCDEKNSGKLENQNQTHNVVKEAEGPNTRR